MFLCPMLTIFGLILILRSYAQDKFELRLVIAAIASALPGIIVLIESQHA